MAHNWSQQLLYLINKYTKNVWLQYVLNLNLQSHSIN